MKRLIVASGLVLILSGCVTGYDITLRSGDVVRAKNKPRLNEQGYYVFKDLTGQQVQVNSMRIREIAPARRRKSAPGFLEQP